MIRERRSLEERLERLEAIEDIRNLMALYCRSVDMRDQEAFLSIWQEDAVYEVPHGVADGKARISEMFHTIINNRQKLHHHTTNAAIEVEEEQATAVSDVFYYRLDMQGKSELMSGTYRDEFSKSTGQWLFKRRSFASHVTVSPIFATNNEGKRGE